MIGDGYFQLRTQIGSSLFSLARLARELGAPESTQQSVQDLQEELRQPYVFLTLGPPGSGKSALLNALFGLEFAGGPAQVGRATLFRHGPEPLDTAADDELTIAERPHIFLRDFTVVDTPGLSEGAPLSGVLRRYLASADLVLAVFPIKSDGSAVWDLIAQMEGESLRRFVFIAQKCDLASPDELPLLVKRLRHTMLTRSSLACPIFPVAAASRTGMEKLERYIEDQVIASRLRREKLGKICDAAQALLAEIGREPREALAAVETAAEEQAEQRLALQDRKDESLRQIAGEHWSLAQAFDAAERRGVHILERRLNALSLVRTCADWEETFAHEVDLRLRDAVARQLETTFEHTNSDLQDALEGHQRALENWTAVDVSTLPQDRTALLGIFSRALSARDQDGPLTPRVASRYAKARALFRIPAAAALLSIVLALAALPSAHWFQPALGLCLVICSAAGVLGFFLRRGLAQYLSGLVARQRETVIGGLETAVRDEIDRFYADLAATLHPLEKAAREQRATFAPCASRVQELEELFQCSAAALSLPVKETAPAAATAGPALRQP